MSLVALDLGHAPPRRVGLLGGSFNPAHGGHVHLSIEALRRLGLDEVWWLVADQNPLKPAQGMVPLLARLATARALVRHPRIRVLDLERRLGTRFTVDTIRALKARFRRTKFVWLMGADNLSQIRHWRRWREIFAALPIAIFARPTYCRTALAALPAHRFARHRLPAAAARRLPDSGPPAWIFLWSILDPHSATQIRQHIRGNRHTA
ncbi:MAG: nicotinate-nucleotide adenylyltransferase [Alphaproteobacteria bacterium]|nr:nicotinate-nucleotide adenylyltransferase [Alphaproteobacteria bacterium]